LKIFSSKEETSKLCLQRGKLLNEYLTCPKNVFPILKKEIELKIRILFKLKLNSPPWRGKGWVI